MNFFGSFNKKKREENVSLNKKKAELEEEKQIADKLNDKDFQIRKMNEDNKNYELAKLREEHESYKNSFEAMEKTMGIYVKKIFDLENQLNDKENELSKEKSEILKLKQIHEKTSKEYENSFKEKEKLQKKIDFFGLNSSEKKDIWSKIINRGKKEENCKNDFQIIDKKCDGFFEQIELQKEMIGKLLGENEYLLFEEKQSKEMIEFQKKEINALTHSNNSLQKSMEELNQKIKIIESRNNNLENEKALLIKELEESKNLVNKEKDKIELNQVLKPNFDNETIKENKNLEQTSKNSENKFDEETKTLNEDKKIIEKLKKKKKETKEKYNELKDEYQDKIKQIKLLKEKLEELKKENSLDDKKIQKTEKKYRKFLSHFGIIEKDSPLSSEKKSKKTNKKMPYDIIINIDSLKASNLGWRVDTSLDLSIPNTSYLHKSSTIIGFVGRENAGKTFLLNKLCGFDLPSGSNVNTKGLSIKYSDNKSIVCLDSSGLQTPVHYYDKELLLRYGVKKKDLADNAQIKNEMINDRTLTDIFIQDFILEICEVIVIVVGQLSQNDQKFIERIMMKYKAKKRIIIVHNFSNLYTVTDVENKIEKDIRKSFEAVEVKIPDTDISYFIEKTTNKGKENVSHYVLGVDWWESGKKYNKQAILHIKKIFDTRLEKQELNIFENLKTFFEENYHLYFQFKQLPKKPLTLECDNNFTNIKIVSKEPFEISNPIFNSLGNLVRNPPYEVFEKKDRFIVLIELADAAEESLKISIDKKKYAYGCLIVAGSKNISEIANEDNNEKIITMRKYGKFECAVPLGERFYELYIEKNENNEKKYSYKKGILKVEVIKKEDEEIIYDPSNK